MLHLCDLSGIAVFKDMANEVDLQKEILGVDIIAFHH